MIEQVQRRPSLPICGALIVGLTAVYFPVNLAALAVLLIVARSFALRVATTAAFLVGLAIYPHLEARTWTERPFLNGIVTVETVPRLGSDVQTCEVADGDGKFLLEAPRAIAIGLGDDLRVACRVSSFKPTDENRFAHGLRARLIARASEIEVVGRGPLPFQWGAAARNRFVALATDSMTPQAAATADGVCFEVGGQVGADVQGELQRSGSAYILSASGLHVFLLGAILQAIFGWLPVPRGVQFAALAIALIAFAGASGLSPSIVRASLATFLAAFAYRVRREPDALSALSIAAVAYLLWRPGSVYDLGFQLSFAVVAGFAWFPRPNVPIGTVTQRVVRRVVQAVHASVVATLFGAPLVAYSMGVLPVVSVLTNLLLGVVLVPIMIAGLVALALSTVSDTGAHAVLADVVQPLVGWIHWALDSFGRPSWAAIDVPAFNGYWLVPYYFGLALLGRQRLRAP